MYILGDEDDDKKRETITLEILNGYSTLDLVDSTSRKLLYSCRI